MSFIKGLDITGIDSAECMCRALRCPAIALFDPLHATISDDDADDPHEAGEAAGCSFVIRDKSGADDYRVTLSPAHGPRPVRLRDSARRLLDLAREVGIDRALGLLESARDGRAGRRDADAGRGAGPDGRA